MSTMRITQATVDEHPQVSQLFEQYRQFYQKPANPHQASEFIKQRLEHQDSTILLAQQLNANNSSIACGFVQLYPCFSSTNMQKMFILNDLFVAEDFRKMSVATALMNAAKSYAQTQNAHALKLCTAIDNHQAKSLYEKLGYQPIKAFEHYLLLLEST